MQFVRCTDFRCWAGIGVIPLPCFGGGHARAPGDTSFAVRRPSLLVRITNLGRTIGPKTTPNMGQFTFIVRLGITGITPTALVVKGRNHVTMLTGNAAFPTPTPTLVAITAACDALDAANQTYDFNRGKAEKEVRDVAFEVLKDLIRELGGYVQAHCNNQKELIISGGFDTRRLNTPLGPLAAPANVRALVTAFPGRLDLRWNGVHGRLMYIIEMTDIDPLLPTGWAPLTQTSKNRHTVLGLTSNTVYSFRLTTVGADGLSPVSDIATAKAA